MYQPTDFRKNDTIILQNHILARVVSNGRPGDRKLTVREIVDGKVRSRMFRVDVAAVAINTTPHGRYDEIDAVDPVISTERHEMAPAAFHRGETVSRERFVLEVESACRTTYVQARLF